jgi:hypothetical protein
MHWFGTAYTRQFVDHIRSTFIEGSPQPEIAGQRKVFCDRDPQPILDGLAAALNPMETAVVDQDERSQSDLRMFFLWQTGIFKNRDIGSLFGLSHSAVSRRVKSFEERVRTDRELSSKLSELSRKMQVGFLHNQAVGEQD